MAERKWICDYDGNNLEPCDALSEACSTVALSKRKGVYIPTMSNRKTGEMRQPYAAIKTPVHPDGIIFGFCPFCGTKIYAPAGEQEKPDV